MPKPPLPPPWIDRFLKWRLPEEQFEEVQGDMHELYSQWVEEMGEKKAGWLYVLNAFTFLRPLPKRTAPFQKQPNSYSLINPSDMFQHNLLLIYRNFKRFKGSFFINLIGLSTGLACTLLIYLWVSDELAFDKFHEKDNRLYQVMEHMEQNGTIATNPYTSGLLAQTLADEIVEVEYAVGVAPPYLLDDMVLSFEGKKSKEVGQFVGKDFFNVFSYPLLEGNPEYVLSDKSVVVLSESLAKKIFNTSQGIVGKQLQVESASMKETFSVSGVFKDIPSNSSSQFDFLLSYDAFLSQDDTFWHWGNYGPYAYVVLKEGTDIEQVNLKIRNFIGKKGGGDNRSLFLKQYSASYLYGRYENGVIAGGRIEYVKLFSIIALFILIIACVNFMNLSTAKASRRVKEIGVKKVLGAHRMLLIVQYFGEAVVMAFISLLAATILVVGFLPKFNEITGKNMELEVDLNTVLPFAGITLIAGLLAGGYPALYLSSFKPSVVLRGKLGTSLGELWARRGLVVFQFTLSVILIVFVVVVYRQVEFVQSKNLGYDKDNILTITADGRAFEKMETFIAELRKMPGIVNASSIGRSMVTYGKHTLAISWQGKDPESLTPFAIAEVNYDMIETLGLELKAGRSFSPHFGDESSKVICNEAAIKMMGLKDPIGKVFKLYDNNVEIVGVTNNFHFESLHQQIKPLIFVFDPEDAEHVMIRIEKGREKEVVNRLEDFHKVFNPGYTLEYKFLDQDYQAQYVAEQRVSSLSGYFAGIAIVISCLGLFGLAAFTAERRRKEIGIRKVLGSSEFGIIWLLSSDFTRIVLMAIVIALPVSYLLTKNWLDNFAFSIDLKWWYFVGAGTLALLIAWITVGMQAVKAARANPVKSLRNE